MCWLKVVVCFCCMWGCIVSLFVGWCCCLVCAAISGSSLLAGCCLSARCSLCVAVVRRAFGVMRCVLCVVGYVSLAARRWLLVVCCLMWVFIC